MLNTTTFGVSGCVIRSALATADAQSRLSAPVLVINFKYCFGPVSGGECHQCLADACFWKNYIFASLFGQRETDLGPNSLAAPRVCLCMHAICVRLSLKYPGTGYEASQTNGGVYC